MVLRSVYFMVKFQIFIPELWDFTILHDVIITNMSSDKAVVDFKFKF
jgi:hypothetical protein